MNTNDENSLPTEIDNYHDRLIDRGLAELIGGEAPIDLTNRILTAAAVTQPVAVPQAATRRFAKSRWMTVAVAASLIIGATILLLPGVQATRESARFSGRNATRPDPPATGPIVRFNPNPSTTTLNLQESSPTTASETAVRSGARPKSMSERDQQQIEVSFSAQSALSDAPFSQNQHFFDVQSSGYSVAGKELEDMSKRKFGGAEFGAFDSGGYGYAASGNGRFDRFGGYGGGYGRGEGQSEFSQDIQDIGRDPTGRRLAVPGLSSETAEGTGPGLSGDQYTRIIENPFIKAEGGNAVSTFSIDVDTASYANVRQFLLGMNTLPPPDAVRIEELINYFDYDYAAPNSDDATPFAAHVEVAGCPWKPEHRLVRIGIKGREMARDKRPPSNLVFLVDVSGSMDEPSKLPLVVYGLQQLMRELGENDRVAIVVYASSEGLVLPSTPGSDQATVLAALGQLRAGGSTAGGAGIQLAYQIAEDHFIQGGTNRVILCTDGDFNVGVTSTAELQRLCEQKAKDTKVFLSVLGFGRGNLNDAMMEAISNRGNGNYHYVDNRTEARRVLVEEMTGTLVTIAEDVKIQVEFNPRHVAGYRLIGYENRMLRTEDFNDDTKDAGEIGAGHTVTALYEIVPAGQSVAVAPVDELKYQPTQPRAPLSNESKSVAVENENEANESTRSTAKDADVTGELLTLKLRYKEPAGDASRKLEWPVRDEDQSFGAASDDFQFAAAVAGFGLVLRDSQFKGNLTPAAMLEIAQGAIGRDEHGYRGEFLELVRQAKSLRGD
jgi:Ca-activated chloride channel family protein